MLQPIDGEVLMAAGYALFLILIAFGLEWAARQSHGRANQVRIAGFKYHQLHDVWECPMGEQLTPVSRDPSRSAVTYRAPAATCNACSMKEMCTASDNGREIEHTPDAWLQSGLARFQRGISLTLLFLAEVLLVIELLLHNTLTNLLLLGGFLVSITALGMWRLAAFLSVTRKQQSSFEIWKEPRL